jgi:hypothetical protein
MAQMVAAKGTGVFKLGIAISDACAYAFCGIVQHA